MRHLMVMFLIVVVLMAGANSGFGSGPCSDCFTASAMVGGYSFDGVQHLETGPVLGIRGGYNFTSILGIEALFDYIRTESTRAEGDIDGMRYGGDVILHLLPQGPLVPFLAAGYGAISLLRDDERTFTDGIFDYGAGIKWYLNDSLALRGDFRHLVFRDVNSLFNYEYTVGVSWQFGGTGTARTTGAGPSATAVPEEVAPPRQPAGPGPVTEKPKVPSPPSIVAPEETAPSPAEETPPAPVPAGEPQKGHHKYCVTLHIESDIDRAAIRPEYRDELAIVGEFMKRYPSTTAVIEGHTDNVGAVEHNMVLSRRRAESVVKYLREEYGIEPSRLTAQGFGDTKPVADNDSDEGRQKNRRVEAVIDCAFDVKEIKPPARLCTHLDLQFATGSATVRPEDRKEVERVADFLRKNPTTTALIEGHTDNVGGYDFNMNLSRQRAESIVNLLADEYGIDRSRLSAKGYGYTRRIAYNNTPEGRQKNRRINAVIDCVVKR